MTDPFPDSRPLSARLAPGPWTCPHHGEVDGLWCHGCLTENEARKLGLVREIDEITWPALPAGWKYFGVTEQITWQATMGPARTDLCDANWGSHGCDRTRGHRGHHWCDPCEHHPWWLHAVLYWSAHAFKRSGLIDRWWGGCVERWPYYGRKTNLYGDDAGG